MWTSSLIYDKPFSISSYLILVRNIYTNVLLQKELETDLKIILLNTIKIMYNAQA